MEEYDDLPMPEDEKAAFKQWVAQIRTAIVPINQYETLTTEMQTAHDDGLMRQQALFATEYIDTVMVDGYRWSRYLTNEDKSHYTRINNFS